MSMLWPAKDPDKIADYSVDWSAHLDSGDTITTAVFTLVVAAGLVIDSQSGAGTKATVWLSGGTAGAVATILNRVTTAAGRRYDQEITLAIDSGLVVEDGTGKADAETFAAITTADAYCARRGLAWSGAKADKEQALRRGFDRLNNYAFKGWRTQARAQAGAFPRVDCTDGDGELIASDEIPAEIVSANIELAVYELANPGGLAPAVTLADRIRSERIGEISVEYAAIPTTAEAARPVLIRVEDLIGGLLSTAGGSALSGVAVRA